jgi:putative ABC transport system permease protein
MAQSVRERTQELALLKAVGFTDALVLSVVLGESLLIALLGGLLGLTIAWVLVAGLGGASFVRAFFPIFFIPSRDLVLGAAFAVGLGLIAGILPALQAMRLHVSEALRREG